MAWRSLIRSERFECQGFQLFRVRRVRDPVRTTMRRDPRLPSSISPIQEDTSSDDSDISGVRRRVGRGAGKDDDAVVCKEAAMPHKKRAAFEATREVIELA